MKISVVNTGTLSRAGTPKSEIASTKTTSVAARMLGSISGSVILDNTRPGPAVSEAASSSLGSIPLTAASVISIDNDKAVAWLKKGAQPTETVAKLLKISGAYEVLEGRLPAGATAGDGQ